MNKKTPSIPCRKNNAKGTLKLIYKGETVRHNMFEGLWGANDNRTIEGIITGWMMHIRPALRRGEELNFSVQFEGGPLMQGESNNTGRYKGNYSNTQWNEL